MAVNVELMFLLVRPHDLVILGVSWSGFHLAGASIEAIAADAQVVLTFPPQHLAEEFSDQPLDLFQAALSGASRVVFAVEAGRTIELSVDGFLQALSRGRILGAQTSIELPWGLLLSPSDPASCQNTFETVQSAAGDVGLWFARLATTTVKPVNAKLGVDPGFLTPLRDTLRDQIVENSQHALPAVRRLELSALGGSLTARGAWDTFEWDQTVALGRDQRVRFATQGVLYPLGHRAVFIELIERGFDPPPAALRPTRMIIVTEPVRTSTEPNAVHRRFPFDEIEITQTTFAIPAPQWTIFRRPVPMLQDQRDQLAGMESESASLADVCAGEGARFRPPEELAGFMPAAQELLDVNSQLATLEPQLNDAVQADAQRQGIEDQLRAVEDQISQLQMIDPDDPSLQDLQSQAASLVAELQGFPPVQVGPLRAQVNALRARSEQLFPIVDAEGRRVRDIPELAAGGFTEAVSFQDLQPQIEAARAKVAELEAQATQEFNLFFTPDVAFPVRCSGPQGDVRIDQPLIFVSDFTLEPTEDLPGFHSLTGDGTADQLRDAYASFARVKLPGVAVDLVRSPQPQPADVHEVHEITLAAVPHEGGFHPQLGSLMVALPALRSLLGEADRLVPIDFDPKFLQQGPIGEVALLVKDYPVDFVTRADRSGGLVSPQFMVNAISRELGPIDVAATIKDAAGTFDAERVFGQATTILGFELRKLAPRMDFPPKITQVPPSTVKMTWPSVQLKTDKPFVARDGSKLDLSVERSPEHITTTCVITSFTLALPLLDVAFDSITFTQQDDRPPHLDVKGVRLDMSGALKLLKELLDKVDLGTKAPDIKTTGNSISAGYALPVPEVTTAGFSLKNVLVGVAVDVPFNGDPVSVSLRFSSRQNPFRLNVLTFAGGGYVDIVIDRTGLRQLEASLEFGAAVSVGVGIAKAEVHALGAIRFLKKVDTVELSAFIRIGGSVNVLGLVSISVELVVMLTHQEPNRLVGRATVVITVDLTLYSDSVTLDSGEFLISGDPVQPQAIGPGEEDTGLADWIAYRQAFRRSVA